MHELAQDVVSRIVKVQWNPVKFLAFELDIRRRATLEFHNRGGPHGGAQAVDWVHHDNAEADPPVVSWFEAKQTRLMWRSQTPVFDPETVLFFDQVGRPFESIHIANSRGEWKLKPRTGLTIAGLPNLPKTVAASGVSTVGVNPPDFNALDLLCPELHWRPVDGESTTLATPLFDDLTFLRKVKNVKIVLLGIASDESGFGERWVVDADGDPIALPFPSSHPRSDEEDFARHDEVSDELSIALGDIAIVRNDVQWRAVGAAHHETHRPAEGDFNNFINAPGSMVILCMRATDPDISDWLA